MKYFALSLLALFGVAAAGRPQLSITVSDGSFAGLGGFDPAVTWSGKSKTGDIDLEYGVDLAATPTTDLTSLPKKLWGKASTDISGWKTSASADVEGTDFQGTTYELESSNVDAAVKLSATSRGVSQVEGSKMFASGNAQVTVKYNVEASETDVIVNYETEDTNVELNASVDSQSIKVQKQAGSTNIGFTGSRDEQSVTISEQIDANNRIAPTITSNGDITLEWERNLGNDNSLTTTVKPNESVGLEWKDAAWTANLDFPLRGTTVTGASISVKRDAVF